MKNGFQIMRYGDKKMIQTHAISSKKTIASTTRKLPDPILMHHIASDEQIALKIIYNDCMNSKKDISFAKNISKTIKQKAPLFCNTIQSLRHGDAAAVLISGLPGIPDSPSAVEIGEFMSLCYAYLLGEPFQYLQQNEGRLVSHITPRDGFENTNSGLGRVRFGWHTDDCIFSIHHRTQWIQLLGMVNEGLTETLISPIDEVMVRLPDSVKGILMQPRFEVKMPTSFGFRSQIWSQPVALVWINDQKQYEVGVPTYHVRPIDPHDKAAEDALNQLILAVDQCRYGVVIKPGALCIFNNNRVLHGRMPIVGKRLVLRTYIRSDLQALQHITGTFHSVFDARFLI